MDKETLSWIEYETFPDIEETEAIIPYKDTFLYVGLTEADKVKYLRENGDGRLSWTNVDGFHYLKRKRTHHVAIMTNLNKTHCL